MTSRSGLPWVRRIKKLVGELYDDTSEAYLATLDDLRPVLTEAGFYVLPRHRGETTLRAYVFKKKRHPLVNPRFVDKRTAPQGLPIEDESLILSVWSNASLGLHKAIQGFRPSHGCKFVKADDASGKLRFHGDLVVPLRFKETALGTEVDFAALLPALLAFRQHLLVVANAVATRDL